VRPSGLCRRAHNPTTGRDIGFQVALDSLPEPQLQARRQTNTPILLTNFSLLEVSYCSALFRVARLRGAARHSRAFAGYCWEISATQQEGALQIIVLYNRVLRRNVTRQNGRLEMNSSASASLNRSESWRGPLTALSSGFPSCRVAPSPQAGRGAPGARQSSQGAPPVDPTGSPRPPWPAPTAGRRG
jgi:hypothetical protein